MQLNTHSRQLAAERWQPKEPPNATPDLMDRGQPEIGTEFPGDWSIGSA